jgi:hypothetical protein
MALLLKRKGELASFRHLDLGSSRFRSAGFARNVFSGFGCLMAHWSTATVLLTRRHSSTAAARFEAGDGRFAVVFRELWAGAGV